MLIGTGRARAVGPAWCQPLPRPLGWATLGCVRGGIRSAGCRCCRQGVRDQLTGLGPPSFAMREGAGGASRVLMERSWTQACVDRSSGVLFKVSLGIAHHRGCSLLTHIEQRTASRGRTYPAAAALRHLCIAHFERGAS